MRTRSFVSACALLSAVSLATVCGAHATTIDSFEFTQAGYVFPAETDTLSGIFTGSVQADGEIELADLTNTSSFFLTITAPGGTITEPATLLSFSYAPGGGASTLEFEAVVSSGAFLYVACVGQLAAAGGGDCGPGGVSVFGNLKLLITQNVATSQAPVVAELSSVTFPSPTPLPSTWLMLLGGLAGLGLITGDGARKRHQGM